MKNYYVEYRVITRDNYFTPQCYIPIETAELKLKENASNWDVQIALSKEFESLGYKPNEFKIENHFCT